MKERIKNIIVFISEKIFYIKITLLIYGINFNKASFQGKFLPEYSLFQTKDH